MQFLGIEMINMYTGKLKRTQYFLERYQATLLTRFHNHLRIRRLLAHLNLVGFRIYAKELVKFLEIEIYGREGFYDDTPLKKLRDPNPMKDWCVLGDVN